MKAREPVIPGDIPEDSMPSLLRNWFLGSKARRYLSRRRFVTVSGLVPPSGGGRSLDVGCGWGYNLFLMGERGYRPVGIDIVQNDFTAASMIARANGREALLAGADVSALPFPDGLFEAVTAVETYEHIFHPDREGAVREVGRVMSPGGVFVLSTPNYHSVVEAGKRLILGFPALRRLFPPMCYPVGEISRKDYHPYTYHRPSPEREIKALLESQGFDVLGSKRIIFVWKSIPDLLFPAFIALEFLLERIPFVRSLGSTLVIRSRRRGA